MLVALCFGDEMEGARGVGRETVSHGFIFHCFSAFVVWYLVLIVLFCVAIAVFQTLRICHFLSKQSVPRLLQKQQEFLLIPNTFGLYLIPQLLAFMVYAVACGMYRPPL